MSEVPTGSSVLVVDDDDSVRLLLRTILARDGWTVLAARTAEEAMALAEGTPEIRLLVTDVLLPGIAGHELSAGLRRSRPELRTLYVSGDSRAALEQRGVQVEESHFLQKPFTPSELSQRARAVAGLEAKR